jgi:hypothetical protein
MNEVTKPELVEPKSNPNGAGRPKGSKDKFTKMKEAFFEAFHSVEVGGTDGLIAWATLNNENRTQFYKFIVALMPKDLNVGSSSDGPVPTKVIIEVKDSRVEMDESLDVIEGEKLKDVTDLPDVAVKQLTHDVMEQKLDESSNFR